MRSTRCRATLLPVVHLPVAAGAIFTLIAAGCITFAAGASVMEVRDDGKLQTVRDGGEDSYHFRHTRSSMVRTEGGVRAYRAAEATAHGRDINRVKVLNQADDDVDRASLTDRREFAVPKIKKPEKEEEKDAEDEEPEPEGKVTTTKKGGDDDDDDEDTTTTDEDDDGTETTTTAGNSTNNTNNTNTTTAAPAAEESGSGTLVAVAGLLFIIIGVIAIVLIQKQKKDKQAKEAQAALLAQQQQAQATGMSSQRVNRVQQPPRPPPAPPPPPAEEAPLEAPAEEGEGEGEEPEEGEAEEEGEEGEEGENKRYPKPGQRILLMINCVSGTDVPDVNTFGGVDPYVEFRLCVGDDPAKKPKGNVSAPAKWTVQTNPQHNSHQPQWNEHLELDGGAWLEDQWLQVIIWDHGLSGNTGIGHSSMKLMDCIAGLGYEAHVDPPHHNDHTFKFANLMSDTQDIRTTVITQITFAEIHKYKLQVVMGERLPKVKTVGTIDSFVEWRVERMDVYKNSFKHKPDESCISKGQTRVVPDSIDPEWKQDFEFTVPGFTNLQLQFIIWDQGSLGNTPCIHSAIQMSDIADMTPGHDYKEFKLKFDQLPDNPLTADFSKCYVIVKAKYDHVFAKGL